MKIGSYEIQVPFVTTSSDTVKTLIDIVEITPGMKVIDLGSGDGRVILEFGKRKASVEGYEIKPELVERTLQRIHDAHLEEVVHVFNTSFWDVDLSQFDIIYLYGMQSILGRLEQKLDKEMKPGAVFISNIFRLPHWKVKKTKNNVHLYTNSHAR